MQLTIEYLDPASLTAWTNNPRTHSKKQISQIADSITEFGFTNPILIDDGNVVIAGHGRLAASGRLKLDAVPCIRLSGLSEPQKRALVIADNKLGLNAGWDDELLARELHSLLEADVDFGVSLTGFSTAELDQLFSLDAPEEPNDPDDDRVPDHVPARCQPGDLWQLGRHKLICSDARDANAIARLMDGQKARMVFTDPPYNVPIDGHVCGSGAVKHREFAMASGEMTSAQFEKFLQSAFVNLADHSVDGSIHFICMDWRHMTEIIAAGETVYSELKNLIVWAKDNGGMGTFYRSRHELIFAFKNGTAPHLNTFELGQHGRYRTNVWEYRGVNTLRDGRMDDLALHPTVKPVQMITDSIKDVSGRGDIVLDLFGGSGSTLIAAEKTGRRGYLCEIDPVYCDRIIRRWETWAHDEAECIERPGNGSDSVPVPELTA